MRTILMLLIAIAYNFNSTAGIIHLPSKKTSNSDDRSAATANFLKGQDANSFLALTPKKIQAETGKKLKMSEKVALRLAQMQVKKQLKKGDNVNVLNSYSNAADAAGKSQLIALILAILVGVLGIHRFYLGYIGIGIIQLLTLGGFGIWALIDLIMIAVGKLKPKGGEYAETL